MDELLVYASSRRLRLYQLTAVGLAVVLILALAAIGSARYEWVIAGFVVVPAAIGAAGTEHRIRRPRPELRLSTEGIEGSFGLIGWDDIAGAEHGTRFRIRIGRVDVRLRPKARLSPPSRDFAHVSHDLSPSRLRLETGLLELGPERLVREIERYRAYASS